MEQPACSLPATTARDLMTRDVTTVRAADPLAEAAQVLIRHQIHGAPVVNDSGQCVGVLSVSDVTRWLASRVRGAEPGLHGCGYQEPCREPGGHETTLCILPSGSCSLQHSRTLAGGRPAIECLQSLCVLTDWQVVETPVNVGDTVADAMTTTVVSAELETSVQGLAQLMLNDHVHRVVVLDERRCPVGVVGADDVLRVLADQEHRSDLRELLGTEDSCEVSGIL